MNSPRTGLRFAAIVFAVICLGHAWRLATHMQVRLGNFDLPPWLSLMAAAVAGTASLWLWRLSTRLDRL